MVLLLLLFSVLCGGGRVCLSLFEEVSCVAPYQSSHFPLLVVVPACIGMSSLDPRMSAGAAQALFTVYDGHGKEGDLCALFCRDTLPGLLTKELRESRTVEAGLKKAFNRTNDQVSTNSYPCVKTRVGRNVKVHPQCALRCCAGCFVVLPSCR